MSLVIKESLLPEAGKGLFTKKPIKRNTRIVEYKGEIIDWKEYEKRVKEDKDGYLFYISKKLCIDAYDTPEHIARYANDARGLARVKGLKNNAEYQIDGDQCYIVATRDIEAGEEIFVSYSKDYWDCIRYNLKHNLYSTK